MQSFHHSRGKIVFEVFCALAIAASCVGAWMQTGASALLAAAAVAAVYGLVHLFDMRGRKPAVIADLKPIESATDEETPVPAMQDPPVAPSPPELPLTAETAIEHVESTE